MLLKVGEYSYLMKNCEEAFIVQEKFDSIMMLCKMLNRNVKFREYSIRSNDHRCLSIIIGLSKFRIVQIEINVFDEMVGEIEVFAKGEKLHGGYDLSELIKALEKVEKLL